MALVRPSFWVDHPNRFAGRDHLRIELRPISQRASRTIARALLGDEAEEGVIERIAERAAGLPLFAEELARLTALGRDAAYARRSKPRFRPAWTRSTTSAATRSAA
jgi:hypothetical protein